jgi:site-specific recombinase XerD
MLAKHVTGFLAYCATATFSSKSIASLSSVLKDFTCYFDSRPLASPGQITFTQLADFVTYFLEPSVHKKKARVWSLHQFFHFLVLSKQIEHNIALGLPYPKVERTVPLYLTAAEYDRIVEHFCGKTDTIIGFRNLVIILIFGLLGLRSGSIIKLNIEHINLDAALAWVQEKGRRERQLILPLLLGKVLAAYIGRLGTNSGPLFQSLRGRRISARSLQDIFSVAAQQLGIDKPLHGRLFRHTAATQLNKVAGTTITQAVLGHERRQNTLKYAHLNPDQYAVYMKHHPYMREARP